MRSGYKLHLVVDARYELPIAARITTASRNDGGALVPLLQDRMVRFREGGIEYVTADPAYDTVAICDFVTRYMKAAPIIPLRKMPRERPPRPDDIRHFPPIPHGTSEWRALYSTRQSVEQVFSRLKQHRALDSHCRRGLRKVTLHVLMSVLVLQAGAAVKAWTGRVESVREVARRVA